MTDTNLYLPSASTPAVSARLDIPPLPESGRILTYFNRYKMYNIYEARNRALRRIQDVFSRSLAVLLPSCDSNSSSLVYISDWCDQF